MSHPRYGNHCMLGQLRWAAADETLTGDGVNISLRKAYFFCGWVGWGGGWGQDRKRSFLMESNERRAKQTNMNHKAVIEIAVVVQHINTESKYCFAGQDQARFCEFSLVAKCPCSIPAWPQAHKHSNRSRQTHRRLVCAQTHRHK